MRQFRTENRGTGDLRSSNVKVQQKLLTNGLKSFTIITVCNRLQTALRSRIASLLSSLCPVTRHAERGQAFRNWDTAIAHRVPDSLSSLMVDFTPAAYLRTGGAPTPDCFGVTDSTVILESVLALGLSSHDRLESSWRALRRAQAAAEICVSSSPCPGSGLAMMDEPSEQGVILERV